MSTIDALDAHGIVNPLNVPLAPGQATMAGSRPVAIASNQSAIPVTDNSGSLTVDAPVAAPVYVCLSDGTNPITTLPASLASMPSLAAGAAIIGKVGVDQTTPGTTNGVALAQIGSVSVATGNGVVSTGVQRVAIASDNTAFTVNAAQFGTWNVTNISGTISLPTGAATAAKQPALGVAGTASTDVITVQGIASMTALKVDGSGVTQPVSGTFWQATQPVSIATMPALVAGSAIVGKFGVDQTTPGTTNAVSLAHIGSTAVASGNGVVGAGVQRVAIASDNTAFAVNAAQSGTWNITNVSGTVSLPTGASTEATLSAMSGKLPASLGGKASSASLSAVPATDAYALLPAVSTGRILSSAATTNATSVKASAGAVKSIQGYNARSSAVFLKLYNKASSPTVGTDTPVKTLYVPATAAFVFDFPAGYAFATGIALALTAAAADNDTTAIASGDILCLNVDYI